MTTAVVGDTEPTWVWRGSGGMPRAFVVGRDGIGGISVVGIDGCAPVPADPGERRSARWRRD